MIEVKFTGESFSQILEGILDFIEGTYKDELGNSDVIEFPEDPENPDGVDPEFSYAWAYQSYSDIVPLYGDEKYDGKFAIWEVVDAGGAHVFGSVGFNNKNGHLFEDSKDIFLEHGQTFLGFRKVLEAGHQANGTPHIQTLDPDECAVRWDKCKLYAEIEFDGSLTYV